MNDDILKLLPEFETLLKTKSFAELSTSEKSSILKFMTIEEYEIMRTTSAMVTNAFLEEEKQIMMDKNLENILVSRMHKKQKRSVSGIAGILSIIFGFKVPVYQVAILLLAGLFLILNSNIRIMTKVLPVSKIDTVFIQKSINNSIVPRQDALIGNSNQVGKKHASNRQMKKVHPFIINQSGLYLANIITPVPCEKTGRSIESDSALFNGLVTVSLNGY
jgi:hypothetical protein